MHMAIGLNIYVMSGKIIQGLNVLFYIAKDDGLFLSVPKVTESL